MADFTPHYSTWLRQRSVIRLFGRKGLGPEINPITADEHPDFFIFSTVNPV
jgi:hypothetical protein